MRTYQLYGRDEREPAYCSSEGRRHRMASLRGKSKLCDYCMRPQCPDSRRCPPLRNWKRHRSTRYRLDF